MAQGHNHLDFNQIWFLYATLYSNIDDDKCRQIKKEIYVCLTFDIFVLWCYCEQPNNTSVHLLRYEDKISYRHTFFSKPVYRVIRAFNYVTCSGVHNKLFWFELIMTDAFAFVLNTKGFWNDYRISYFKLTRFFLPFLYFALTHLIMSLRVSFGYHRGLFRFKLGKIGVHQISLV